MIRRKTKMKNYLAFVSDKGQKQYKDAIVIKAKTVVSARSKANSKKGDNEVVRKVKKISFKPFKKNYKPKRLR